MLPRFWRITKFYVNHDRLHASRLLGRPWLKMMEIFRYARPRPVCFDRFDGIPQIERTNSFVVGAKENGNIEWRMDVRPNVYYTSCSYLFSVFQPAFIHRSIEYSRAATQLRMGSKRKVKRAVLGIYLDMWVP